MPGRRIITMAMLTGLLLGCARGEFVPTVLYSVEPEIEVAQFETVDASFAIRPLEAARPYRLPIQYRTPGNALHRYYDVEWAEMPRDTVTRAIMDGVIASGRFADVGHAANMRTADYILTGFLRRYEEARDGAGGRAAVCEVYVETRTGFERDLVWSGSASASVPIEGEGFAALAAAMSEAVAQVAAEIVEAVAAEADAPAPA